MLWEQYCKSWGLPDDLKYLSFVPQDGEVEASDGEQEQESEESDNDSDQTTESLLLPPHLCQRLATLCSDLKSAVCLSYWKHSILSLKRELH